MSATKKRSGQITRSADHPVTRFFLIPLLFLSAPLSPEAQSGISRLNARYVDGAAHRAAFTHLYTAAGFQTPQKETGEIWIQSRDRLRFDYTSPEKKTFTYDSGEARLYAPEDKQLTIEKLTAEDRARLPVLFLTDPAGLSRSYEVAVEPDTSGAIRLVLKPRAPRPELARLSLTVDADGSVPLLSYEDAAGNRTEFRFSGWRREKPRPDSDYRITGPKGTRVIEN
jgi:outer membrane lipoprotein carrier protein